MDFTLFGITTEVKPIQSLKALSPIVVTLEGMLIEVKPLQREKADDPIVVTLHTTPSHSIVDCITISP